jgi:GGDEF domain-containing protein
MKGQLDGFRDLYRIIQVDHLAEPEVIEGAYKRLSKKYHPDTNKNVGAEARMKLINQAYGVLSDSRQRAAYDRIYQLRLTENGKKQLNEEIQPEERQRQMVAQAADLLRQYLTQLSKGDYADAYLLISKEDHKYISQAAFLEWQSLVGRLYEIGDYQCVHFKTYRGKEIDNKNISLCFEFQISMAERERSTGKVNQVDFSRLVVFEKNHLQIYLGYQDIAGIIAKFKQISTELETGEEAGPDRQWLLKEINREMARAARYNRPLALVLLDVVVHDSHLKPEREDNPEDYEMVLDAALQTITHNLRQHDSCGRWSRQRIMVILPETRFFAVTKVVQKIFTVLKTAEARSTGPKLPVFCAGIVPYKPVSPVELLYLLYSNTIAAKNRGDWKMFF